MGIKDFKINPEVAQSGLWVAFSANADGTIPAVLLARTSKANKPYWAAMAAAQKKYRRQIQTDTLTPEQDAEIALVVFCEKAVLNWRHIQPEDDGVELKFSSEAAKELLGAPEWEVFYNQLTEEAAKIGNIREDQIKVETKN